MYRRIIRIKALQQLYAFFIQRQVAYEVEEERLRAKFVEDIFYNPLDAPAKLALEQDRMLASKFFYASIHNKHSSEDKLPLAIQTAVQEALNHYMHKVKLSEKKLKANLEQEGSSTAQVVAIVTWLPVVATTILEAQHQLLPIKWLGYSHLIQNAVIKHLTAHPQVLMNQEYAYHFWQKNMDMAYSFCQDILLKEEKVLPIATDRPILEQDIDFFFNLVRFTVRQASFMKQLVDQLPFSWQGNKEFLVLFLKPSLQHIFSAVKRSDTTVEEKKIVPKQWEESLSFYLKLVSKVIEKDALLENRLQDKLKNWSIERLSLLDKIIIKLCLVEFEDFPEIPKKVSMDEYIEVAKQYGTDKSGRFINGLLAAASISS